MISGQVAGPRGRAIIGVVFADTIVRLSWWISREIHKKMIFRTFLLILNLFIYLSIHSAMANQSPKKAKTIISIFDL